MIRPGQFSNLSEKFSNLFILSASFKNIQTEWLMLMTKSNRGFFSSQGDVHLRLMIRSGKFSHRPEISMSTLSYCKFQEHPIKTEWVSFFQQATLKPMIRSGQFLKLTRDFIRIYLICKFQEQLLKTKRVMAMTNVFPL